ncbi:transporter [Halomonas sp. KM-1]|uniref:transporter n=1 Tax=Halomonas sp. KM-1 TaxID=590061 RepID=UPI000288DE98|nr:transporter [Halomonas sp. KM-1]
MTTSLKLRRFITGLTTALALSATAVQAADLNARDFLSAPAGTSISVLYLANEQANRFRGAADPEGNARLDVNALVYRQVWFSNICGRLCTPQFVVPLVDVDAHLPGAAERERQSGLADPQVGGTLFFVDRPEDRVASGLLSMLTLPVGEYDGQRPGTSPGANRWAATFVFNYTQGVGERWVLEANLEAQLYGDNDDYLGMTLEQDPLYRLQAFASYDLTQSTYGALRLIHAEGGALQFDGQALSDTRQRYTQLGVELGHRLTPRHHLMLSLSHNVDTDNAFHGSQALLRLARVW